MVLYAVFATDQLAPGDRALLVEGLENSPASMHQPTVEAAIAAAGFEVVRRERIASEWSEYQLEHDPGYLTQDLLEVARLTRTATTGRPCSARSGTGGPWGSPPGGCRSCSAGSCRSSMPWSNGLTADVHPVACPAVRLTPPRADRRRGPVPPAKGGAAAVGSGLSRACRLMNCTKPGTLLVR